jgi:hypothetical protein
MDSLPQMPEATLTVASRRHPIRRLLVVSAVVLVLLIILFRLLWPSPQFIWLTPAQAAQANRPGLLTQLKYKLMRLSGPLMRYYSRRSDYILISTEIFNVNAAVDPAGPDAPCVIKDDGSRAWILSPDKLISFRQGFQAYTNVSKVFSPRIQTSSGGMTRCSMTQSVPGSTNVVGFTLDVTARSTSRSVNLFVDATDTSWTWAKGTTNISIITNFAAACRTQLADAGGLVINCRGTDPASATNYWLIISPMLVDATGKPIKK